MQQSTVGRHRIGAPGRFHVSLLVRVARRNLLVAWFVPAKHRRPLTLSARPTRRTAAVPV